MDKNKRGALTQEIKDRSKKFFKTEMTRTELRLLPFIAHCCMNGNILDSTKINRDEWKILLKWEEAGHLEVGSYDRKVPITITKELWEFMAEILYISYIDVA